VKLVLGMQISLRGSGHWPPSDMGREASLVDGPGFSALNVRKRDEHQAPAGSQLQTVAVTK
jgi:hypothetical protein